MSKKSKLTMILSNWTSYIEKHLASQLTMILSNWMSYIKACIEKHMIKDDKGVGVLKTKPKQQPLFKLSTDQPKQKRVNHQSLATVKMYLQVKKVTASLGVVIP